LFSVGSLLVGAFFVAVDYQGWNTGMVRARAEWRRDKSRRPEDVFDDHHAVNTAIGWVGAVGALLLALTVAIEALTGFRPSH
jgi:hypothetical protein